MKTWKNRPQKLLIIHNWIEIHMVENWFPILEIRLRHPLFFLLCALNVLLAPFLVLHEREGTSYRCQNQMGMKLEKMEMHTCKRSRKKPRQINVWFTLLLACHRKKSKVKVGDDWVEIMDSAQRCDLIVFCPVDAYS